MEDANLEGRSLRYRAFVSYTRSDRLIARSLQRQLERYVLPRALQLVKPGLRHDRKPLKPVFRDEDEMVPGQDLPDRIRRGLEDSEYLIVVCSPAAAHSEWVEREIRGFMALGRSANILAVVAEGAPYAEAQGLDPTLECLPPSLRSPEPLWVDWRGPRSQQKADFLRLVAALLSLPSLDELVRRDAQYRRNQTVWRLAVSAVAVLCLAGAGIGLGLQAQATLKSESNTLAEASQRAASEGDFESAARYAVAGLRRYPGRAAHTALVEAVAGNPRWGPPLIDVRPDTRSIAISGDGSLLAGIGEAGDLRLWNIATWRPIRRPLASPRGQFTVAAFMPGRAQLVAGARDGVLRFWDPSNGRLLSSLTSGDQEPIRDLLFSTDGDYIVAISEAGRVDAWRRQDGAYRLLRSAIRLPPGLKPALSPDGGVLFVSSLNRTRSWDIRTGRELPETVLRIGVEYACFDFSPDRDRVVTGNCDGLLQLWNTKTGQQIGSPFVGHHGPVQTVTFSHDGRWIASGGSDQTVRLWDAYSGDQIGPPMLGHMAAITAISFSPDDRRLVSASEDGSVRIWDLFKSSGRPWRAFFSPPLADVPAEEPFEGIKVLSPSTRITARGYRDGTVRFWEEGRGWRTTDPALKQRARVSAIAVAPDDLSAASGDEEGRVRIWDRATGSQKLINPRGASGVASLSFSPDGKTLAGGFADRTIQIWDAKTGRQRLAPLRGHGERPIGMLFSNDGALLLTWSQEGELLFWRVADGRKLAATKSDITIESAAFSPSDQWIALGGWGSFELWNVREAARAGQFELNLVLPIRTLRFGSDERSVVFGPLVSNLRQRVWQIDPAMQMKVGDLIPYACTRTIPGGLARMTPAELASLSILDRRLDGNPCQQSARRGLLGVILSDLRR